MIVVDSSAWIEYLRGTGSAADEAVSRLVKKPAQVAVLDVVLLELLAGAGDESRADEIARFLARFTAVRTASPADHELAAALYRAARRAGETVRSLLDCLIAAAALRLDAAVLAQDRDFDVLARTSSLRLA